MNWLVARAFATPIAIIITMMRHLRAHIGLSLALALIYLPAMADTAPRVLNAAYLNFPPLAYTDHQGNPAGEMIELSNRIAAEAGVSLIWKEYPINRIYRNLGTGEIDFWPGSQAVPALSDTTLETGPLDVTIKLCAYAREGTPMVSSTLELGDARLILIRGYTYRDQLDYLFENSSSMPIVAPNHIAALQLLEKDRGDYLIHFAQPFEEALKVYPVANLHCNLLHEWPLALVISRQTPQARELVESLQGAYERIRSHDLAEVE